MIQYKCVEYGTLQYACSYRHAVVVSIDVRVNMYNAAAAVTLLPAHGHLEPNVHSVQWKHYFNNLQAYTIHTV